jgi:hypothetical protein
VRSLCLVRSGYGSGTPGAIATIRFTGERTLILPRAKGVSAAQLLESQPVSTMQTAEQRIRGGDATADKVLLVGGYDADAVRRAAEAVAIPGAIWGLYRLSYSLAKA